MDPIVIFLKDDAIVATPPFKLQCGGAGGAYRLVLVEVVGGAGGGAYRPEPATCKTVLAEGLTRAECAALRNRVVDQIRTFPYRIEIDALLREVKEAESNG